MNDPPRQPPPFAAAMEWVAKITTVSLEMVLPAVVGHYLDRRWASNYWVLVGLGLGVAVGMLHLLQMTQPKKRRTPPANPGNSVRERPGQSGE